MQREHVTNPAKGLSEWLVEWLGLGGIRVSVSEIPGHLRDNTPTGEYIVRFFPA